MSWCPADDAAGYDLYFNRDESRRRAPALPPAVHAGASGARYLAATDPEAGGSWLATTGGGETFAVLNFYGGSNARNPAAPRSRGLLVSALARGELDIADIDPRPYQPFLLLHLRLPCAVSLWRWDGDLLEVLPATQPVSTSSFATADVLAFRAALFRQLPPAAFHRFHDPARRAHSPRMARADASTVSIIHLEVRPDLVRSRYFTPPDFSSAAVAQL